MSFEHAWVLLLASIPIAWAAWEWQSVGSRTALALKAASLVAVILALADPRLTFQNTRVAVAILADTSRSVSQTDLARASAVATEIEKARGLNWTRVIPFARVTRNPGAKEGGKNWNLQYTAGDAGHGTNLEAAIREAIGTLPEGMVRRVALISDGNENLGSVTRATWQAQQLGIPIDTFALAGSPKPDLRIESVSIPAVVFSGERFPIDVTLSVPQRGRATVEITAEAKSLGVSTVDLEPGVNHVRVRTSLSTAGAIDLAGKISTTGMGAARFEHAVNIRRPRVLLVSKDPPGTEAHLLRTLEAGQFDVQMAPQGVPDKLDEFQIVAINNWDLESVPAARKAALEKFVQEGGGLLWIAGERNVFVENKPPGDLLDRALPAKLAPPRSPEGTGVILIIDKSSSMEGKKMELARLAAIGVIDNLRPIDQVGVLIFDNSFQWAVPVRRAEDRSLIKRLIAGITPDGGTQIAPALTEAFRKLLPVQAVYKHIVLLTDGISEEGDSLTLSREASANRVTISTVGLGQDVNRAYLEKVASFAKGRSYFLNDPSGLEQILLKDVMEHTGSTAVEKAARAPIGKKSELLDGVGMEEAPALRGYVRYVAKPTADTLLNVEEKDPLLVRWQYGLGRAAVFTSDAKSRWAANWVSWKGFDRLWANVFRDLLPHAQASEATAEYDSASDELAIEYRLSRRTEEPETVPDIYVLGPAGFRRPVKVSKIAAGNYRARVAIDHNQGLFRVRPLVESRAFPEIGFYREEDELSDHSSNEFLLRQIAQATGGRFQPQAKDMFQAGGRSVASSMELWPGLLALALLLNLAELFLRKGRGLLASWRQPAEVTG
ncbi:MAG: VWA domain-containing protein [Candidatus Solibacter usitatus]|nr:VWA domain-containing protein [Candidatus Solibacter usitatus]